MITDITLSNRSTELLLGFSDGQTVPLSAEFLRANAMDALSRRERIDHGAIDVDANIQITTVNPVGHTGLNIAFSDGNNRAIFPYQYLISLARRSTDN